MRVYKRMQAKEYVADVLCNKCGKNCRVSAAGNDECPVFEGLIEQTVSGNEYTDVLEDMTHYTFSICGTCLKQLFSTFKYPVQVEEYSFG